MKLLEDLGMSYRTEKSKKKVRQGRYECKCGNTFIAVVSEVKRGRTIQCKDCLYKKVSETMTKYRDGNEKDLYRRFLGIKARCYNKNSYGYDLYGGKGVTICDEWLLEPTKFIEWSLNNGYKKEYDIDKDILSSKLGLSVPMYSPDTCLWVDKITNIQEARGIKVEIDGVIYNSKREAERVTGKSRRCL